MRKVLVYGAITASLLAVSGNPAYGSKGSSNDVRIASNKTIQQAQPLVGAVVNIVEITNLRSGPGLSYTVVGKAMPGESFPIVGADQDWHLVSLPSGDNAYVASWVVHTETPNSVNIVDNTNLRSGPGLDYKIVGKAKPGDTLPIVDMEGDWYVVLQTNGDRAYVASWIVHTDAPNSVNIVDNTNLRSGPGLDYKIVGKVKPGDTLPIVGLEGEWYVVKQANGERAYVASWVVTTDLNKQVTQPKVYIYHTHNRESWKNVARDTKGTSVDDSSVNITLVGKHLGEKLQTRGIAAVVGNDDFMEQLKKQNLSYSLSYAQSRKAIDKAIQTHPALSYFFDIHRDADVPRKNTTVTIGGKSYAKILFVVGTAHSDYKKNKKFAEEISERLNKKYPGLSRGVLAKNVHEGNGEYNQSVSPGSLLLEIGGVNNTLEESKLTAEVFADVFAEYYKSR